MKSFCYIFSDIILYNINIIVTLIYFVYKDKNMAEIALVTGASRGIGAEIAKTLARDGFDIWLNYRSNSQ